ncbi:hypothetical protein [Clostridium estertheticum]|nr:hypothetical protein [Clostridium estertheticum]
MKSNFKEASVGDLVDKETDYYLVKGIKNHILSYGKSLWGWGL